jgi:hypothetical protein
MAKIGRNDPCVCGSGKKYKNCCINKTFAQSEFAEPYAKDPEWLKIRGTEAEMVAKILEFALSNYGGDVFEDALEEFGLWGDFEVDDIHRQTIFLPWMAFNWIPDDESVDSAEPEPPVLGLQYLLENAVTLDPYQRAFIQEACAQPYSFFVITDVTVGETLGIRDIFLDRAFTVKESAASKMVKRGDILFARIVELEGQAIMLGMAPTLLPPPCHRDILDARDDFKEKLRTKGLKLDQPCLLEYDAEMRNLYFDLLDVLSNPPIPQLQNTDGDPLAFVKLYYKLSSTPQEAVDALKSLSLPEFQDHMLDNAIFDADGNLTEVSFGWHKSGNKKHKSWDNTVLGNLTIKGDMLTAEVDSEKRAEKIESEIEKRLKKRATLQRVELEDVEGKLEEMKSQGGSPESEEERREQEEFQSLPEIQALVRKQMEAHWEAWYTQKVPALNNKTPLQAARTKSGRERLEALLLEFERRSEGQPDPNLRVDVAAIRKKLGM